MNWWIIIEYFGPNVQHESVVDKIIAYMLSIIPSEPDEWVDPTTIMDQSHVNELFTTSMKKNL